MTKKQYITKMTAVQALEGIDMFLVSKIALTDQLYEPTARALGRMEAFKETRKALEIALRRAKKDMNSTKDEKVEFHRADISHVKALSK